MMARRLLQGWRSRLLHLLLALLMIPGLRARIPERPEFYRPPQAARWRGFSSEVARAPHAVLRGRGGVDTHITSSSIAFSVPASWSSSTRQSEASSSCLPIFLPRATSWERI